MQSDSCLKDLVNLVARLYPLPGHSHRVVQQAGLQLEWIAFKERGVDTWFSIFDEAKKRGRITDLIEVIIKDRNDEPELQSAYSVYLGAIAQQQPLTVDTAVAGLEALAKLIEQPEIQQIILVYRDTFLEASQKIDDMGNYKDLHDLLHELQVHCHDPIAQISERRKIEAKGWKDINAHRTTLLRIDSLLQNLSKKTTFKSSELKWIKGVLAEALELLKNAVEKKNSKQIAAAIALINHVLDTEPPLINLSLNSTARDLQMSELALSMTVVRDKVVELKIDSPEVHQFISGVEDLINLSDALTAQIHVHDTWQDVDRDLRFIESQLSRDLGALKSRWPEMKKSTTLIYHNSEQALVTEFKTASGELDRAVTVGRIKSMRDAFREYRRLAIELFYMVDINLKDFCGELRKIGGAPLSAVTNALHDTGRSRS